MKKLAAALALFSAALGGLLFFRPKSTASWVVFFPRLLAGALAPFNALIGGLAAVLGLFYRSPLTALLGGWAAFVSDRYVRRIGAPHQGFEKAFGVGWEQKIPPERQAKLLRSRTGWALPSVPQPRFEQDVPYAFPPDPGAKSLLCDLWQPPAGTPPSGLAFIYIHGGAWYLLDKDVATRIMFRHLAAQGHVVMDVAYRMYPEMTIPAMVGDIFRAVAWMRDNAARLEVDPQRIVLSGGSAGGHLALLAAYTPDDAALVPPELAGRDLSVRGVVSLYGPSDLRGIYRNADPSGLLLHPAGIPAPNRPADLPAARFLRWLNPASYQRLRLESLFHSISFDDLLGVDQEVAPALVERLSPATRAQHSCPPTLLLQGEGDMLVAAETTQTLYARLVECGVPAIYVLLPQTEHGFDLVLPVISPSARAALYDIERFLAVL